MFGLDFSIRRCLVAAKLESLTQTQYIDDIHF